MMYERLLDKNNPPAENFISELMGVKGYTLLLQFEDFLNHNYHISREMKFPFGNNYGWGYKYSHKSSHLCYAFFESGAFTITLQLGDNCAPQINQILPGLSQKVKELWQNRYPCGEQGGWIHYRVTDSDDLNDVLELVKVKGKPSSSQKRI
ncbi:hypothetical protein OXPF_02480 [Oxobacter pfennigii]|uniref:DUF3788 domain-containing protein n=1 Tax=Oxobacter pfennigii TaxID=36849 RepID=A0A0P8WDQ8_9CLOT|nr:DUF3788 domain-containing protein [Oxobacter pfennigii]KPU46138.1 hypothetical protein OXPF_02480 [Oxobacter pfennigii]